MHCALAQRIINKYSIFSVFLITLGTSEIDIGHYIKSREHKLFWHFEFRTSFL